MITFLNSKLFLEGLNKLSLDLSEDQKYKLDQYASLLYRWNKVFNLTSLNNKDDILTHHILDSLAVVSVFQNYMKPRCRLLDVGSGGGLPGIPLAILFPECSVSLVDTVGKKAAFLTQVSLTLKLKNVTVFHDRVENIKGQSYDLISSRAFASLTFFVEISDHLLKPGGYWLALKGQYPTEELSKIKKHLQYSVIPIEVPFLNENRNLVILWNR